MSRARPVVLTLLCSSLLAATARAADQNPDAAQIEAITGAKGQMNAEQNVFKVSYPPART
jgi:hypothetical protein